MAAHRLLLIRHARTEEGSPDRGRRLTAAGERDAAEIGRWLAAHDARPDRVVVSTAIRARQTWDLAAAVFDGPGADDVDDRIYVNTLQDVLAVARATDEAVRTLAIVGHNPTIEALALTWGAVRDVPTGAIVDVEVDGRWAELDVRNARATDVVTCRG